MSLLLIEGVNCNVGHERLSIIVQSHDFCLQLVPSIKLVYLVQILVVVPIFFK